MQIIKIILQYFDSLRHYTKYINCIKTYKENYKYDDMSKFCYIGNMGHRYFMFNYRNFNDHKYENTLEPIYAEPNSYKCIIHLNEFNRLRALYKV